MHADFLSWAEALEKRHTSRLTFQEVRRGLTALSQIYVQKRDKLAQGAALDGAGKRAAFAWFYGALHFLLIEKIVQELGDGAAHVRHVIDLGCGTGVGGCAWALQANSCSVEGYDINAWAVEEAAWNYQNLGIRGVAKRADLNRVKLSGGENTAYLACLTVNELSTPDRSALLDRLLAAQTRGSRILIVEPIAKSPTPWWSDWVNRFTAHSSSARCDEWRFPLQLPERLRLLDKAAGLSHQELTARTLFI